MKKYFSILKILVSSRKRSILNQFHNNLKDSFKIQFLDMVDASSLIKDTRFAEISENEIVLKNEKTQQSVVIDRRSFIVSKRGGSSGNSGSNVCSFPIQGVYGIIDLVTSKYLMLITRANFVGEILSKKIFQVDKITYVPLDKKLVITNPKNMPIAEEDKQYIEMLDDFFAKKFNFFSYELDLTSTLQRNCENNFERGNWKNQYFFNENHMQDFIKNDLSDWIAPVISGLVEIKHMTLGTTEIDFILVSRRDKRRTGMRFVSRGCDLDGNCSNTADTEQILVIYKQNTLDLKVVSYVQLRGSMPFLWQQKPDMKWEPKGDIYMANHNFEVARKHFDKVKKDYGNQVVINLIDKRKIQQKLGAEFQRVVEEIAKTDSSLRYIWFDFHHECRKMKYENLSRLLNLVEIDTNSMGLFEADIKKSATGSISASIVQKQKGTFRTNCVDCLDRTNVVQSVIGRKLLHFALIHAKLSEKSILNLAPFEKFSEPLEPVFREIWTRNADALSILYTGTGALKTDFTRTGKRTRQGAFNDGKNSIMRYVKNHFYDGYNQNCVDLVVGRYKPKEKEYKKQKINNFFILVFLVLFTPIIMSMVLNTLHAEMFEPNAHDTQGKMKGLVFYASVFGLSVYMVFKAIGSNRHKFVEKPILNH